MPLVPLPDDPHARRAFWTSVSARRPASLALRNLSLNPDHVRPVADALSWLSSLDLSVDLDPFDSVELDLAMFRASPNQLAIAGTAILFRALESSTTLRSFTARWESFILEIGDALAELVRADTPLTSLRLDGNTLGDYFVEPIASALETNTHLAELHLAWTEMSGAGAAALAKALDKNRTLTTLGLSGNDVDASGVAALARALETNSKPVRGWTPRARPRSRERSRRTSPSSSST